MIRRALFRCDSLPLMALRLPMGAGITAATLVNTSCAAYHTTDSGENRSRCCLYTQADINDLVGLDGMADADPSARQAWNHVDLEVFRGVVEEMEP